MTESGWKGARSLWQNRRPFDWKKDTRKTLLSTRQFLNRHRWTCLGSTLAVLLLCLFVIHPHDVSILGMVQGEKWKPDTQKLATDISHWGDFAQFNLLGFAVIWTFGYLRRARWVQRLAFASLFAAILAGLVCNVFRFTMGRPRPNAKLEDGFYGLPGTLRGWDYHGFPSGHTSTAFGTGVPITVAGGPIALPAVAFSASVGWARMYKNKHFPTDVIVGGYIGILFGVATSWKLRAVRLRLRRMKKARKLREAAKEPETRGSPAPALETTSTTS